MTIRIARYLEICSFVLAVILWLSFYFVDRSYHDGHLPHFPRQLDGQIYPSDEKGDIVYLTQSEDSTLRYLQADAIAFFCIGGFFHLKYKQKSGPPLGVTEEQLRLVMKARKDWEER